MPPTAWLLVGAGYRLAESLIASAVSLLEKLRKRRGAIKINDIISLRRSLFLEIKQRILGGSVLQKFLEVRDLS